MDTTSEHYKGPFKNIYEVHKKFPGGGSEGDYVDIGGFAHYWNADRGTWCVNENRDAYWDDKFADFEQEIDANTAAIEAEVTRAQNVEHSIDITERQEWSDDAKAQARDNIGAQKLVNDVVPDASKVEFQDEDGNEMFAVPASTTEKAGAMTAEQVQTLNNTVENLAAEETRATGVESVLQAKIDALASGATVSTDASPGVVYKGVATAVALTGSISKVKADTISLHEDSATGAVILAALNASSVSAKQTYTLNADKTIVTVAEYKGMQMTASKQIYARYPVYAGFGTSASAVAVDGNKLSARTSAAGTYSGNAAANGVNYYILVPTDVPALSSFTMGGAPFVMESSTETINSIVYKVYKSGSTYNSGASVNIQAS